MTLFKKFLAITIALVTISSAYARNNDDSCCTPCPPEPCCAPCPPEPCCDIPGGPTQSAFSHPARVNVCGSWDVFASASFLYWAPREDGLNLAGSYLYITPGSPEDYKEFDMSFDFKPSFKVLLGYNFEYDNWQTLIRYTRMNMNTSTSHSGGANIAIVPSWFVVGIDNPTYVSTVSNKWNLDFNIFDWEIGRPFYDGKQLTANFFYGLKSGWIDQSLNSKINYSGTSVTSTASSDSWIFGPRVGLNTNFVFVDTFRMFGDFAASLFYQNFSNVKFIQQTIANPSQNSANAKSAYKNINYATELAIGLGWGTYFDNNNWYFDISAAYELQLYFNQNKMRSFKDYLRSTISSDAIWNKPGDLQLHGLT
jgi:hypothetical protein